MSDEEVKVKANMKVIGKEDLFAIGSVTIDGLFTINNVKVKNLKKPDGEESPVVLFPRKKCADGHWEPIFSISNKLRDEITAAITQNLVESMGKFVDSDDLKVSVKVYTKNDLLGYATVSYADMMTVKNIRILKADNADGIRLDFPYSYENGKSYSLFNVNDAYFRSTITQLVSQAYQDMIMHPENNREKEEAL